MPTEFPTVTKSLTTREIEVIRLVAKGTKPKEIGELLCVEKCTVDFHLSNIYGKFLVNNKLNAILVAKERGIV